MNSSFEQQLLGGWEEVFKRSQLTLWILLSLKDGPKHMADIKAFTLEATNGLLEAEDKSMYRALRRYHDVEMVTYTIEPNDKGPDRKVYALTDLGLAVLNEFLKRNIVDVFFKPEIQELLSR